MPKERSEAGANHAPAGRAGTANRCTCQVCKAEASELAHHWRDKVEREYAEEGYGVFLMVLIGVAASRGVLVIREIDAQGHTRWVSFDLGAV